MSEEIMHGVTEYAEGYDVVLESSGGRSVVSATNEGGYNGTSIDLEELLEWVSKNRPEQYAKFTTPPQTT